MKHVTYHGLLHHWDGNYRCASSILSRWNRVWNGRLAIGGCHAVLLGLELPGELLVIDWLGTRHSLAYDSQIAANLRRNIAADRGIRLIFAPCRLGFSWQLPGPVAFSF